MVKPVRPIDYTNIGYDSLREAMRAIARESLPEYTDLGPNDLGAQLIDLVAHASDITLYYQTRIANNLFPATADEPDALVHLLRLIGYELRPPSPATAELVLAFDASEPTPISIPAGTQFFVTARSGSIIGFETTRAVTIQNAQLSPPDAANLRYFFPLPVTHGETVKNELLGFSDGRPNQIRALGKAPAIDGSIEISVIEPPPIGATRWKVVTTLAQSGPTDRHLLVQRNAVGAASAVFGDNVNAMIPATGAEIRADYRVGGGLEANLPASTHFRSSLSSVRDALNPQAAGGGAPGEDLDRARFLAPRLFRSQDRAVTASDYVDLALQVPGVGKALAVAVSWNKVVLYVAPSGQVAPPSELLERDLLAFLESKRMASAEVVVVGPSPAEIYLAATIRAQPFFLQSDVQAAVEAAVGEYLAFDAVGFGQTIYLSKIYDIVQSLPQVASLTVTEFNRAPHPVPAASPLITPDGTIALKPHELPRPGYAAVIVTTLEGGVVR